MQKWEYAFLIVWPVGGGEIEFTDQPRWEASGERMAVLKQLGDEGWEMVCASGATGLYFKRSKR